MRYIFQKTVFKEFAQRQNQEKVQEAYKKFSDYFLDNDIQNGIRQAKEEQYQEGFLRELFVNILGYVLNPLPNYNLTTELKNPRNQQKVDGAVVKDNKAIAVIELKSMKTIDLQMIELQAFGYKHQHENCRYVITSNFAQIRFYLDNALDFEEFDLFNLDFEGFLKLYTLLHADNLLADLPILLKEKSIQREEEITLAFYNDYQGFKEILFDAISQGNNKIFDKFLLFQKTQKLLDRFVFLCFAQYKGLVPANLIGEIIKNWHNLEEIGEYRPLYMQFKKYFYFLHSGYKGKPHNIFGYNGGLFMPDEVLDNLENTNTFDVILENNLKKISNYNFDTDIDVNILGHIFECSLAELEQQKKILQEVQADMPFAEVRKQSTHTKRREDGIFYTPRTITDYMIQHTLGKMCADKKQEIGLNITEIDTNSEQQKQDVLEKIEQYFIWLASLKILDPACGSGAFLNQVLNFLIIEYTFIQNLKKNLTYKKPEIEETAPQKASKTKKAYDFFDNPMPEIPKQTEQEIAWEKETKMIHDILENNIFGVDINMESVSITKLSLWLRVAQGKRKLNDLSQNIKIGNSLISDKNIDEKAFDWEKEFPTAQKFDLIVGNPPYVDIKTIAKPFAKYYFQNYETAENRINLYALFIEKAYSMLVSQGVLSFIVPNSLLVNSSYLKIRQLIYKGISIIVKLPDNVFEDANVETMIFVTQKDTEKTQAKVYIYPRKFVLENIKLGDKDYQVFDKVNWNGKGLTFNIYASNDLQNIIKKTYKESIVFDDICSFSLGITPYDAYKGHTPEMIKNKVFHASHKKNENYKPLISGKNIMPYFIDDLVTEFIDYGDNLGAKRNEAFFTNPRIIVRQIISGNPPKIYAGYTEKSLYFTQVGFAILSKDKNIDIKYILAILNSKLINFVHKFKFLDIEKEIFQKLLIENCKKFPIKNLTPEAQQPFIEKVNGILALQPKARKLQNDFLELLTEYGKKENFTKKMENWYSFSWEELTQEFIKSKIIIPLKQKQEWKAFFQEEKTKTLDIFNEIQRIEQTLNQLIYECYDLTAEEILIVENAN